MHSRGLQDHLSRQLCSQLAGDASTRSIIYDETYGIGPALSMVWSGIGLSNVKPFLKLLAGSGRKLSAWVNQMVKYKGCGDFMEQISLNLGIIQVDFGDLSRSPTH